MIRSPIRKNIEIRPINNNPIRMETRIRILFPISITSSRNRIRTLIQISSFMGHLALGVHSFREHKKATAPSLEILFY